MKTYTLELTADEALEVCAPIAGTSACAKVVAMKRHVEADRDGLDLPWRAQAVPRAWCLDGEPRGWLVGFEKGGKTPGYSERAAKLMSAAPELLDLLSLVERVATGLGSGSDSTAEVMRLARRARRKVETGQPEPNGT